MDRPARPNFLELRQSGIRRGFVAGEGNVVNKRVEPDIGDVVFIERQLDAPAQAFLGAGNAEIDTGVFLKRIEQLGFAEGWEDDFWIGFDEVLEPIRVVAEFEIPVFLLDLDNLTPLRAEISRLIAVALLEELLLPHRVVAGVGFFVELALMLEIGEDCTHAGLVARVGGFRPTVVIDAEFFPKFGEFTCCACDVLLG